jgi:gluconokinase
MNTANAQRVCSVGIDLGTTGIKVIAYDATAGASGEQIALAARSSHLHRSADGAAELDPLAEQAAIHEALAEAVAQAHAHGFTIARISISAPMHSLLAVDASDAPITPVITWADLRAQADAQALWASPQGPDLYARTGTPIHAMAPVAKLLWLRRVHPEIWQRAARFVGLKSWLWREWFGEWVMDVSLASATGLYNLRERRWDTQALTLVGLDPAQLPTVVPAHYGHKDRLPEAFRAAGVDQGCAIAIGASDGVLANLGVHATDGRRMVVTIGTSLAVRVGSSAIRTDPHTRAFCYVLSEERGLYILGAPSNSGGLALEWVYQQGIAAFAASSDEGAARASHATLSCEEAMAAAGEPTTAERASGLYFLPYIAGERAPFWTTQTTGALVGLRSEHTAIDTLRAAAEGIMLNGCWIAEPILTQPHPPEAIIASGGAFQSDWMRQLAADIFGLPVYEVASIEASARGAALLADLAVGALSWSEMAEPLTPTSVATPDPARQAAYREKSKTFRRLALQLSVPAS